MADAGFSLDMRRDIYESLADLEGHVTICISIGAERVDLRFLTYIPIG